MSQVCLVNCSTAYSGAPLRSVTLTLRAAWTYPKF